MSKLAAIVVSAVALFDAAPSCKPAQTDECGGYRGSYYFGYRSDILSPIALRTSVSRTGVGTELNEPKTKCSIVAHESYDLVACPGEETGDPDQGEHFPGCGEVFCIQALSYPPTLWFELEIPESGCDGADHITMEEIELPL